MTRPSPKLSAPALQANVVPTRVLKLMGRPEAYHGHWLFAGPGAGKTQLARLWIEQLGRPYAWLQLDPQDNDPLVLLEQLRLALQPLVHPQVMLPRFAPQSGVSLQRHCEYLWEMLLDTIRTPCVLVLDDAHHISTWHSHPVLHSMFRGLDSRVHQLVLSRADLEDAYVRDVVNRRVQRVGPSHFQWKAPQLRAWVKRRWSISNIEDRTANAILALSQGRAAILALLDIKSMLGDPQTLTQQAAKQLELSDLMESSLLAQLSSEERETLFWLACLASFPRKWLYSLGFPPRVQQCVQLWQRSSSVVHSLERGNDELRFHPLFAEVLRNSRFPSAPKLGALRDRLIEACVAKGRALDAIALCRSTRSWNKYWELLQSVGLEWMEHGQIGSLAGALSDLPDDVLNSFSGPPLSLFIAATILLKSPRLAYVRALDALEKSHAHPELRAVWANALALVGQAVIASGTDLEHLRPVADAMEAALKDPWFLALPAQLRLLALQAGLIASLSGLDHPPMRLLYRETERAILECTNSDIQLATISALARVVLLHGLPEYVESVKQHIFRAKELATSPAAELNLLHAKTNYYLTTGDYQSGLNTARAHWARSSSEQPTIWSVEILASAAFCAANTYDLPSLKWASDALVRLREHAKGLNTVARLHSQMYLGSLAAHEGKWTVAYKEYLMALEAGDENRYSLMQVGARCCLALVCLELNRVQEAKQILRELELPPFSETHQLNEQLREFLRAFLLIRDGDLDQASSLVGQLLHDMNRRDYFLQVAAMLPHYAELLSFGLTHKIRPELIHKIIRRGSIYPPTRPHPDWPSLIEVKVLGRFQIHINGIDARHKLVSSGRRFELLTVLLWWGGQNLSFDQCITWIWSHIPEKARAIRSIKTALKRLNEDLGRSDAILEKKGYISINPNLWEIDAMQLYEKIKSQTPSPQALNQINRGFIGPTPIPRGLRNAVPNQGAIELGPEPLLPFLGLSRWNPSSFSTQTPSDT